MQITSGSKDRPGSCPECGDSPTAHIPTYITGTLEAWTADRREAKPDSWRAQLSEFISRTFDAFIDAVLHALTVIGLFRTSTDIERACSYRSQVIWEEAHNRGLRMEQLSLFGKPTELYRVYQNGLWRYFQSLPVATAARRNMYASLDDKLKFKQLLQRIGIPVANAVCVRNMQEARAAFERLGKPVIAKPRIGSRGRHTTTNIQTKEDLETAFKNAQVLCKHVIIEEHLHGGVSRATVVDGRLEGFLQLFPARVVGSGEHTIAELVRMKNQTRPHEVAEVVLNAGHLKHLARAGYSMDSVPARGEIIDLSRHTGRFAGGSTRESLESVHPKLRAYAEKAAQALHAPIVGFDIIIPDPEVDPALQRWGFLEANSLPFIDLHYLPLEGKPSNVAAAVWNLWNRSYGLASPAFQRS